MKRILAIVMMSLLALTVFAGCTGTTVVVNECTCESHTEAVTTPVEQPTSPKEPVEGAVKTGLAVDIGVKGTLSDSEENVIKVEYDLTLAAVTVDDQGVIVSCVVDSVPASITLDGKGQITSDLTAAIATKNELGENYGMVAYGNAVAEWDQQVAALCRYAEGKTVEQLRSGAIDESGKAPEGSDLATSATIYLGGYINAIEKAAANAQTLGAHSGDQLKLVTTNSLASSVNATEEKEGCAQLDTDIAVVTLKDGVITSCIIDSAQVKVNLSATGEITTDLTAGFATKNELGEDYGMVAWGNAIAEWNEQAAAFAAYVTGKTAAEVAGISVTETTKPADGTDLAASVTIAVGGFQALIAKAFA